MFVVGQAMQIKYVTTTIEQIDIHNVRVKIFF